MTHDQQGGTAVVVPEAKVANAAKVQAIKDILVTLNGTEMKEIEEFAKAQRSALPFRFMELPKELRVMIYDMAVTPDIVEAQVTRNKMPALLNVNQEIREDFADYYYGPKVFQARLLKSSTWTWEPVKLPSTIRAMFEGWPGCYVSEYVSPIGNLRSEYESFFGGGQDCGWQDGVVTWTGALGMGAMCMFSRNAVNEGRRRMESQKQRHDAELKSLQIERSRREQLNDASEDDFWKGG